MKNPVRVFGVKDYFIGEIRVGMNPNGVFPAFKHSA